MNNFVSASESANHCQRNWSEKSIPQEIIDELVLVATNMPTKQNEEYYTLIASSNVEYNHTVYMHSYAPTDDVLKLPFEQRHTTNFNTQFRAPLLFQWFSKTNKALKHGNYYPDGLLSIGISAGAVALAANQLNLKTGFGVCLHTIPLLDIINKRHNEDFNDIAVTLAIGYPIDGVKHNVVIRPDGYQTSKNTYNKTVRCIRQ